MSHKSQSTVSHMKDYNLQAGAETSVLADRTVMHRKKLDVSCNLGLKQYNFSLNGYLKLQDLPGNKKIPHNLN